MYIKQILFLAVCFYSFSIAAKPLHFAYIGPKQGESVYWDAITQPLPAVAKQLGVKLTIHSTGDRQRLNYYATAKKLLESKDKPDYLISMFLGTNSLSMLELIEKYKVPYISIATAIPEFEKNKIGLPGQIYKYWKAQILANEKRNGYRLARNLIRDAKEELGKNHINILAFGGDRFLQTSVSRNQGLQLALKENARVHLIKIVDTNWLPELAIQKAAGFFRRHKDIDVIWAVNDEIALAAEQAYKIAPDKQNYQPYVGGFDCSIDGMQAVLDGQLQSSLCGSRFFAAWALIVAYDLAKGEKLDEREKSSINVPFFIANKETTPAWLKLIKRNRWNRVDFKQFSKAKSKNKAPYNFDFTRLVPKAKKRKQR